MCIRDSVWFEQDHEQDAQTVVSNWLSDNHEQTLCVSSKTELLYDHATIFINAESIGATGLEGEILKKLANQRFILPVDLKKLTQKSPKRLKAMKDLLSQWMESGWIHLG